MTWPKQSLNRVLSRQEVSLSCAESLKFEAWKSGNLPQFKTFEGLEVLNEFSALLQIAIDNNLTNSCSTIIKF